MKNITISKDNESKRLNRFLFSYFGSASEGFIYKMLRKKNIVLNDKKASGNEILKEGDIISVYFSDETFEKFKSGHDDRFDNIKFDCKNVLDKKDIVFEDDNIIVINKRAGILSQKSQKDDVSINEMALNYMYLNKEIDGEKLKNFVPSILNRLDRNTSGLIIFGKNYKVSKLISLMFAENKIERYYIANCYFDARRAFSGKGDVIVSSDYIKDEFENKACLSNTKFISENEIENEIKNNKIVTRFKIINSSSTSSKIETKLETGKSHQIRAQLFCLNLPIIGEAKYINYNDTALCEIRNKYYKNINGQLLCAYKIILGNIEDASDSEFNYLSGKNFSITPNF